MWTKPDPGWLKLTEFCCNWCRYKTRNSDIHTFFQHSIPFPVTTDRRCSTSSVSAVKATRLSSRRTVRYTQLSGIQLKTSLSCSTASCLASKGPDLSKLTCSFYTDAVAHGRKDSNYTFECLILHSCIWMFRWANIYLFEIMPYQISNQYSVALVVQFNLQVVSGKFLIIKSFSRIFKKIN